MNFNPTSHVPPQLPGDLERTTTTAAAESERARLAEVFRQSPTFMAVVRGPEFVFELVNEAYYRLVGKRDLIGLGVFDALPEIRGQGFEELLEGVLSTGVPFVGNELPVMIARTTGAPPEERFVDFVYLPLVEADGSRSGIMVHGSDVTEHVRGRQQVERLLGESEETRQQLAAAYVRLQGQQLELERANEQLQESAIELECQAEELQSQAAELEQRTEAAEEAREEVAAREQEIRTLADAIPTLAWTARADGFIDWYNARWYEYTGTTPAQMEGWGWQSVHDPEALPGVMEQWRGAIDSGLATEMTFPLRGSDGQFRRFLTRITPLLDGGGHVMRWFGTNTDVEAERLAREAAESANQAKTDFLATMSHELRTPLNAIAGYAELMELGIHGPITDSQREAISRIRRSQRHLLGLINDVLNFAKLEAGHVEFHVTDVSVRSAVEALEPLVAPQLSAKSLQFSRDECADVQGVPLIARADRDKLQQILVNLLSNAIKFTAPGGRVKLQCSAQGDEVTIAISDTGIGIAADRIEQVFAPFVQVDRNLTSQHEGTGLGLSISRDLARGMRGELSATSEQGVGSTFTLTLPRA